MTRYFFDTRDGDTVFEDLEGLEFPDINSAEQAAVVAVLSIARDAIVAPLDRNIEMSIRTGDRKIVATYTLTFLAR